MGRKLHRDAACGPDSLADATCQFEMVAVAGRKIIAGLRNSDDRRARLQFLASEAVVEIALEVERGHAGVMWIVEPFGGTKFAPDTRERLVHGFSRSAHAPFWCAILTLGDDVYMTLPTSQIRASRARFTTLIQRHRRKSLIRPPPQKGTSGEGCGAQALGPASGNCNREEVYVVRPYSRRAEIVWQL